MTPEQRYLFDINGYLHLPNVLSASELAAAQPVQRRRHRPFGGFACWGRQRDAAGRRRRGNDGNAGPRDLAMEAQGSPAPHLGIALPAPIQGPSRGPGNPL